MTGGATCQVVTGPAGPDAPFCPGRNRAVHGRNRRAGAPLLHQRRDGTQMAQARRGGMHGPEQQAPIVSLEGDGGRARDHLSPAANDRIRAR